MGVVGVRQVVLLCGPPGAGKSTLAHQEFAAWHSLTVYDRDEPQWHSERQFTAALRAIGADKDAQAVVIRTGATSSSRRKTRALIGATATFLVLEDRETLRHRITQRSRGDLARTLAGVDAWFERFDNLDNTPVWVPGLYQANRSDIGRTSREW